ncbi:hypothetical protein CLOM_g24158 [Closterium sp. NIES-68]|nr:hypothetical protein CLOM_g24158 [Closterium sp. NIES-68]GJP70573.1 hypothetical protein CLOP_g1499 [Closterium sp. NIES-67]
METTRKHGPGPLPLRCINHVSIKCASVQKSLEFYSRVLGFQPVKRPEKSLSFDGAWLFNYGIGLHLLGESGCTPMPRTLTPRDNHIAFQSDNLAEVERKLIALAISFVKQQVLEDGILVDQIFFFDPDNYMIEVCNCDLLPVIPIDPVDLSASASPSQQLQKQQELSRRVSGTPPRRLSAGCVPESATAAGTPSPSRIIVHAGTTPLCV